MRIIDIDNINWDDAPVAGYAIKDWLNQQPVIDAAPVVHGYWIEGQDGSCTCSECNIAIRHGVGYYCLNCGAKMDAW